MKARVLIVHYTPPGVVGGVEHIIHQHIELLTERGFQVGVVAGRAVTTGAPIHVISEIDVARPENVALEAELASGVVGDRFFAMCAAIADQLTPLVAAADAVIAHNAFTLHFSLPLTSVLWDLVSRRETGSVIAWSHDLAWTNPLYIPMMHHGFPWDLLRTPAPNTRYVTVSTERKLELAELWGDRGERIAVIPNGVDAADFLRLSASTREIVDRYQLFERDAVLLLPVRITRRKNIEAGIGAVQVLKARGLDVFLLISGPVAPHHPTRSRTYLQELKLLREELGVEKEVVFLADALRKNLDHQTVAELYSIADALLFPSAQEGFGLPILEAGLAKLPVVLSDIPVFREVGGDDVCTFNLDDSADTIAAGVMRVLDAAPSRLFRRVLREYRWDAIVDRKILPILPRYSMAQHEERAMTAGEDEPTA